MRQLITFSSILIASVFFSASVLATDLSYQVEKVVTGLSHPWGMAELPDGKLLVTERSGQLRVVSGEELSAPISGLPDDIYVKGQGGLQDVALHPDFASNGWVYISYSAGTDAQNTLKISRAKLNGESLADLETIFTLSPFRDTPVHYGARLQFLPDGTLLVTSGDGFDFREDAQRLENQMGKTLRMKDDGTPVADNPFHDKNAPYVYTLGHRNPQGLVYHAELDRIFLHEHGPAGGDEINVLESGQNYGWPIVTNGRDYSGASISPFTTYPGMTPPFLDWTPSIAPSGLAVYQGEQFPDMQGDLLVGALKDQDVKWVKLVNGQVSEQVSLFSELAARIRDVSVSHSGAILLLSDANDGVLYRITAKN